MASATLSSMSLQLAEKLYVLVSWSNWVEQVTFICDHGPLSVVRKNVQCHVRHNSFNGLVPMCVLTSNINFSSGNFASWKCFNLRRKRIKHATLFMTHTHNFTFSVWVQQNNILQLSCSQPYKVILELEAIKKLWTNATLFQYQY